MVLGYLFDQYVLDESFLFVGLLLYLAWISWDYVKRAAGSVDE